MESSPNYHPLRDYSAGLVGERRRPVKTQLANLTTTLAYYSNRFEGPVTDLRDLAGSNGSTASSTST